MTTVITSQTGPTKWYLLVPEGVEVEVRTSPVMKQPVLLTDEQLKAGTLAAAQSIQAGLPVDLNQLFVDLARPGRDPAQQELDLGPVMQTAPEDLRIWPCVCGVMFTAAKGGEVALRRHQATCGTHAGMTMPPDRRVD